MKSSLIIFFGCLHLYSALPEPGIWEGIPYNKDEYLYFTKSMFKDTMISMKIECEGDKSVNLTIGWVLRYSPCNQEFQNIEGSDKKNDILNAYYETPDSQLYQAFDYSEVEYIQVKENLATCDESSIINLASHVGDKATLKKAKSIPTDDTKDAETEKKDTEDEVADKNTKTEESTDTGAKRKRRALDSKPESKTKAPLTTSPKTSTVTVTSAQTVGHTNAPVAAKHDVVPLTTKVDDHVFAKTWKSGSYVLIVKITPVNAADPFDAKVTVSMKGSVGYISAFEWPLLIFYGVMGIVYILYGLMWLVMLACNWRDLLRVQYWVGGVILLGMLEKAVFYSEYQSIANTGRSVTEGAVIFAEVVSCLKRALARMLVIIVSLGFGIVKPRLGPTFHKVLFVGGLYFVLATIEGCMRMLKPKGDQSTDVMLSAVPLAVVDASICWWIFSSLVQTTRQLRLRRNIVKLTLYRHFTNTLIFAVLASIIFMIWSIVQIKIKTCLKDWEELWIDEAFWHLLFSVILLVIMILWRPSSNNQRYAFSPLLDTGDDDEEDDPVMNDAFDGMKMRSKQANGSPKQKQASIEDDLKWVEENIPSAISDKAQTLLDSDEEVMTTKYEMSKMQ